MSLSVTFLDHVPTALRARMGAVADLEAALARLVAAGKKAWPEIRLDASVFVAFVGRTMAAETAVELDALRAADLYLVCSYGLGVPHAAAALDGRIMPKVAAALGRLGTPAPLIADIQQELRQRLVEMCGPAPDRSGYAGRGDLAGWLCISAVREASRKRERGRREQALEESEEMLLDPSEDEDPEMAYLRRTYKEELQAAFQEALASLSSRDRNLLRYHFLDGLSIDRIGLLYNVHRATAARWINQARQELCVRTRELVTRRISLSQEGFDRLLGLIASQLSMNLASSPA